MKESKCINLWLHDYQIISDHGSAVAEVCTRCNKRKVFQIRNGKPDALEYYKYHLKQALQPNHPLYKHEYKQHKD